jgi:transcriptional regulator GlxA family with amidase domain
MTIPTEPIQIGILVYPGVQMSAVLGLTDLFEAAERLRVDRGGPSSGLKVTQWPVPDGLVVPRVRLSALIVPPSLNNGRQGDRESGLAAWILDRPDEGTLLCSVCAGAILLAEAGVLDGRPATTHWALAEYFSERFPAVLLDTTKMIVDDGDIVTAGGVMAWIDLGLMLINRFVGPRIMLETARLFVVDPGSREQRFYSVFAPILTHGDADVLRVQHWLQTSCGEKLTLPLMAKKARLGERTYLRRFRAATGFNPVEYLQHVRVAKARGMLELSNSGIDEIAWKVGYEDPGAFRRIFQRQMGLSPGEYRRRFAVPRKA